MTNTTNSGEIQSSNEDGTIVGESIGRKFDVSKPQDRADLEKYLQGLSKVAGKNAHENDTLKRQLAKVQSTSQATDDQELLAVLNSEESTPSEKLLATKLLNQGRSNQQSVFEANRSAYYAEAVQFVKGNIPGLPFEDDEVIDALLRKHEDRIRSSEDPAAEVLKVFTKYAGKQAPAKKVSDADDHIGFGSSATPAPVTVVAASGGKKAMAPTDENAVFAAMGFGKK